MHPEPQDPHDLPANAQLTGHEYDGIAEYDNPMPTWWRRIFWATFVFSIGYYVHYQLTGNGASVEDGYAADMRDHREKMAAAALGQEMNEGVLERLLQDPAMMKDARSVYQVRCVQCHADRGQGNIGPNLTDDHWLYGSASLMDIYEIISNGRPQKGMPTWSRTLRPVELAQVSAYIGSLRNTNVPGRAPQGTRLALAQAPGPSLPAAPITPAVPVAAAPSGSTE